MADDGVNGPRPLPTAAEWEAQRPLITRLRENSNNKLDDIMKEMQEQGFYGTKAVYKKKFSQWGLSKNISSAAAIEADRKRKENLDDDQSQSEILINGKPVPHEKITRQLKRARIPRQEITKTGSGIPNSTGQGRNKCESNITDIFPSAAYLPKRCTAVVVRTPGAITGSTSGQSSPPITNEQPQGITDPSFDFNDLAAIDRAITESIAMYQQILPEDFVPPQELSSKSQGLEGVYESSTYEPFSSCWNEPIAFIFNVATPSATYDVAQDRPRPPIKGVGHQKIFEALLHARAARSQSCDTPSENGETPFWLAAHGGFVGTAKVLALHGADINIALATADKRRPIHQAAQKGHLEMVRFLLEKGALLDAPKHGGATALWLACQEGHTDIVRLLLEAGASPVATALESNRTPFHQACRNGHLEIVKLLLQYRVNINELDKDGAPGLRLACHRGHKEVASLLIKQGADVNAASPKTGRMPLHQACQNGHEEIVRLLVDNYARIDAQLKIHQGVTPLWIASYHGHTTIVSQLLNRGANPNSVNTQFGRTPLHQACQNGKEDIEGHVDIVSTLLAAGADINLQQKDGVTALFIAAQQGHAAIVKLLLDNKAKQLPTHRAQTMPIHQAATGNHLDIVKLLLEGGADINSRYKVQVPLLLLASNRYHAWVREKEG
ncbi:ankyrin repeat-containing domain protein [Podospora fimiseda]|uniref:Ankyrin repeat-containing domain protein n=1 Tax=Podospora fimiseda TaxID=252190 RepID=A0AAN6YMS2_9PEZI|nr:ankyrin repeat-containing domain protein [Podospora fimiseda]